MAPRGTPRDIINRLNGHLVAILAESETRVRMFELGIQPTSGTPDQRKAFVQSEAQK